MPHDDVIKWKHFPRYWPYVRGIHRSSVNSPHKGQWRGALMFSFICAWINGWVNNREAGDLRHHRAHYDVIVMCGYGGYEAHSSMILKFFNLSRASGELGCVITDITDTNAHSFLLWQCVENNRQPHVSIRELGCVTTYIWSIQIHMLLFGFVQSPCSSLRADIPCLPSIL